MRINLALAIVFMHAAPCASQSTSLAPPEPEPGLCGTPRARQGKLGSGSSPGAFCCGGDRRTRARLPAAADTVQTLGSQVLWSWQYIIAECTPPGSISTLADALGSTIAAGSGGDVANETVGAFVHAAAAVPLIVRACDQGLQSTKTIFEPIHLDSTTVDVRSMPSRGLRHVTNPGFFLLLALAAALTAGLLVRFVVRTLCGGRTLFARSTQRRDEKRAIAPRVRTRHPVCRHDLQGCAHPTPFCSFPHTFRVCLRGHPPTSPTPVRLVLHVLIHAPSGNSICAGGQSRK